MYRPAIPTNLFPELTICQSKKLFGAPVEEKVACAIQTNNRGWGGLHSETLDPKTQKVR